jgi:pimeloyl-ACP methyl ester carboxylesterase
MSILQSESDANDLQSWVPAGFTQCDIDANGTRLSCALGGSGTPMILIHGWPQTGRAWRLVMQALARNHTVVVPDLRGTGASERPVGGYKKIDQAEDMRALLNGLRREAPSIVVGHDIGVIIAYA